MIKRCLTSLVATLIVCFLACSSASARVCFLPDSTDCGEGDVVGSGNVDVPCQYSSCPAYNTNYQECYDERTYNNGGVNVTCKQIKCKLSKSECEKQEADPNSSQCCNFDRDSGCYYMGSCKLCNRDVFDSEKNLGEGYDCYPCKDKNGTFYNCTAKEKECNQINSNYTSSCGDSQIAKEVEGIKDIHGNQCYTCEDKPAGSTCTYKYGHLTLDDDTHGDSILTEQLYRSFQIHAGNTEGASYYWNGSGSRDHYNIDDASGYQIYSKIDKNSKSCQKGNKTAYETICPGTAKGFCEKSKRKFVPNGCSSEPYVVGRLTVVGMEFGACGCDTSKRLYDTEAACRDANSGAKSLECTPYDRWCYQTCEDAGMYSSEDACKTNAPKYTECNFNGSCYKRNKIGWGIHYTHKVEKLSNRTYVCSKKKYDGSDVSGYSSTSWNVYVMNGDNDNRAQALNGNKYRDIDDHEGEVRYPAGKYKICFDNSFAGSSGGNISMYYMHLAKRSGDWCDYRWNDHASQWHPDENNKEFCSDAFIFTSSTSCIIATFEDNTEYYVQGNFKVRDGIRNGEYIDTCKQQEQAPY